MNPLDIFMFNFEHVMAERYDDFNVYRERDQIKISPISQEILWHTFVRDLANICDFLRLHFAISNNVITIE